MKKGTTGGYRATEYDRIVAPDSGGYIGKSYYCVIGLPGLWRRVKSPGFADPNTVGVLPAYYDGIIYLVPDPLAISELIEGGIAFPNTPGQKIVDDLIFARLLPNKSDANGFHSDTAAAEKIASPEPPESAFGEPVDDAPTSAGDEPAI